MIRKQDILDRATEWQLRPVRGFPPRRSAPREAENGLLSMEPMPVDGGRMIFNTATIRGFWLSEWLRTAAPEQQQAVTAGMLRSMATNEIVPPVEAEYPLADVLAAVEHAERPGRSGKVLLVD